MPIIVLKVVSLVFERVKCLILDFPACSAAAHDFREIALGYLYIRDPAEMQHLLFGRSFPVFYKIHQQILVRCIQRDLIDKTELMNSISIFIFNFCS
ncbi:MAG: hypothetical protein C4B59_04305 [Candidatus Methanogaster sp.]|uniref:Uncharacterized protein n=1 Tax=Candidatus Methanogaster sp. TaxID=3386292 RepID=A0AC61L534_9EURY|nr:MAG: hypothetical protein C4B59_04305 [ANME-2 cluster archaeon]